MKEAGYQLQSKDTKETSRLLPGIRLVIFDVDDSLVVASKPDFYCQYGSAVNRAVASFLGVDEETGKVVADYYRSRFGGGEQALFSGTIGRHFPQYGEKAPDFKILYEVMSEINPQSFFTRDQETIDLLQQVRNQGILVAVVTSTAEGLSRKILAECGFNPDTDFDLYRAYTPEFGPPKIMLGADLFSQIAEHFEVSASEVLSIGDSYRFDIAPAISLCMKTCLIGNMSPEGYEGMLAADVQSAILNFGN